MSRIPFGLVVGCGLLGELAASLAVAQTTTVDNSSTNAPSSAQAATLQEVVVSGTRLLTAPGFSAPTPVTSVTIEDMQLGTPSNIPDALNKLPQFTNSQSDRTYFNSNSQQPFNGNYLNLRGIGPERSLILLDGRRVPPTSYSGAVDVNTLPQMLVERVDVVTAGASAAYGSDAVSGVVNYILDRKLEGLKVEIQGGDSSHNDAASEKVGLAGGRSFFDDRLHAEFSLQHYHRDGLPDAGARRWGTALYQSVGSGTAANPYALGSNVRFGFANNNGVIASGPLAGQQFQAGGTIAPFVHGTSVGGGLEIGGDGSGLSGNSLMSGLTTDQGFGRLDLKITDTISAFGQVSYARSVNNYNEVPDVRFGTIPIFSNNAYLAPSAAAAFAGTDEIAVSRFNNDFGPQSTHTTNASVNATMGLEGAFGDSWKWSTYYTYGRSDLNTRVLEVDNQRFFAALDAVRDPASGNIVCNVTLTNPGLYPGCVPLNIFGTGSPSQAAIDYIHGYSRFEIVNEMNDVAADIRGTPFKTWAGDVAVATGVEYRHQTLDQTSNADPAIPTDFTGLRGASGNTYGFTNVGTAQGAYGIKEVFGEFQVPLAHDVLLAQDLELNAAARYVDYSTSGKVYPWKFGLVWEPIQGLRFRGTRSRDIRAPSLYDLYAKRSVNPIGLIDPEFPQLGVQAVNTASEGNSALKPEVAKTTSVGVVIQPPHTGLSMSIDYYNLDLNSVIANSDAYSAAQDCYNSGGTSPECAAVVRDPTTHRITEVKITPLNLSQFQVKGVDTDLSYQTSLPLGHLSLRSVASYLQDFKTQDAPNSPIVQSAGTADGVGTPGPSGLPRWRGTVSANYNVGDFGVYVGERWIGSLTKSNLSTLVYAPGYDHISSVFYTDLTLTYNLPMNESAGQVYLTVNDLFNRQAPLVPGTNLPGLIYPTLEQLYDIMGTYVSVGVRFKF